MNRRSIFWGLILLGSGALILLYALGYGQSSDVFSAIASLLLISISIASFIRMNFVLGTVPLAVIFYLWREPIGFEDLHFWPLVLGAFLLGVGLSVIFWTGRKTHFRCFSKRDKWSSKNPVTSVDDSEEIEVDSTFGEHVKYVRSANFKKARIDANFASVKVFFDQCTVSPEGAVIEVDANFAGVELHIPRTWNIDNQTHIFVGNVEGAAVSAGEYSTVTLIGEVNFGSVKIVYL